MRMTAIPFAKIRLDNKPKKFAGIRMANIVVYVFFNFYFLVFCPWYAAKNPSSFWVAFYQASDSVFYIFVANLLASITTLLLLYKEILQVQLRVAMDKLKPMLVYALPLLFAGLAGMVNETLDRILLKFYLPGSIESRLTQIGIYNAAYKLSIFMTLATQAFRMAAEPFFFKVAAENNAQQTYAKVMRYYVIACCAIFLGVMTHINFIETLIGPNYRSGLHVVPILLLANLFFGIYMNLSIWFKLGDKTYYGFYFTLLGAIITIGLNVYLIPIYGFVASAYTTLACYFIMMLTCYFVGQKHYPVPYEIRKAFFYFVLMLAFYFFARSLESFIGKGNLLFLQLAQTGIFILYIAIAFIEDFKNKKFA
jgi:O-antigen/teichoic acid export membrane protein